MSLKINDLLRIPQSDMDKVKIKFNQPSPDEDPLDLYRKNPDIINTQWLFWREQRRYFYEGQIAVCFLDHSGVRPHKEKINISKECINKTR